MNKVTRLLLGLLTISMAFVGVIQPSEGDKKAMAQLQEPELSLDYLEQAKQQYYAKLRALPWGKVADKYIKQLESEEKALMAEWYKLLNDTEEAWQQWVADNLPSEKYFDLSKMELKYKLKWKEWQLYSNAIGNEIIDDLLQKCYIEPKYMNKCVDESDDRFEAARDRIMVDSTYHCSSPEFKAVIMHEIMHILHADSRTMVCMGVFADAREDFLRLYMKIVRFQEKRADIFGALLGPEYVYGLMNYLIKEIDKLTLGIHVEGPGHPCILKRIRYLGDLYKEMVSDKVVLPKLSLLGKVMVKQGAGPLSIIFAAIKSCL